MVCESCELKQRTICVPDKWKEGSKNHVSSSKSSSSTANSNFGGVKAGKTNKALASLSKKANFNAQWLPTNHTCKICKSKVLQNMNYCNDCAHKKGICSMCGKKTVDTASYNMSLT
eukprot:gene3964-5684_t